MNEYDLKHAAEPDRPRVPETATGATGVFGTLPADPEPRAVASAPVPTARALEPLRTPLPDLPSRPVAPPVVHEVKFEAPDESGSEAERSLHRLLQSLPPANTAPPLRPASTGDFTQLLSALYVPAAAAAPLSAAPPTPVPPPVQDSPAPRPDPMPVLKAKVPEALPPPERAEDLSFTRLFESLTPAAAAPYPAPAAPRGEPEMPRVMQPVPSPLREPASGSGNGAGSFTQLFAALDRDPASSLNQAADYPPLQRARTLATPPAMPPPVSFPATSGAGIWPPVSTSAAVPSRPLEGQDEADLNSLTQLLRALESSPVSGTAHQPLLPSREAAGASPATGATVAFTPPESVQRLAAKPPPAPSGPGDFTRVLQASALRESGLGSQAAAAAHVPEPPAASRPPVSAAAAPLPPWAAPPMPYLPQMPPHLSQVNSSVPALGPVPGLHRQVPAAFVTAPAPQQGEGQGVATGAAPRGQVLLLI